jgi:CxxC motif-containing protein (DUF1111 family)
MSSEQQNPSKKKSFTGWKGAIVYTLLGGSIALICYTFYHSHWQAKTGYGQDHESLAILDKKDPRSLSGGDMTHFKFGNISFEQEPYNLHWKLSALFDHGDGMFERPFTAAVPSGFRYDADGLGPLYNADGCESCHAADGRAAPPLNPGDPLEGLLFRVSVPGKDAHGGPKPHPIYGGQLADKAIDGHKPEVVPVITYAEKQGQYPDGTAYSLRQPNYDFNFAFYGPLGDDAMFSPRIAPAMIGMGLLDAIDSNQIEANADPEDKNNDGISGKANLVWNAETMTHSIGKYGWKSETPTLKQQIADAAVNDMGITNELFSSQNCTQEQTECNDALHGISNNDFELSKEQLDQLVVYLEFLAIPGREPVDHPKALRGEEVFQQANCSGCHTETWVTGNTQRQWRLRNQTIHPYTDLLLHDMGEGLADNRPSFEATGQEWRTAPLWGIGMTKRVNGHTFFLHDGRARNLEEAILWHGGEAEAAKQYFMALPLEDREALLAFLRTL